jgi:O-antigen/teichoic acid export membrane protein
VTLVVNYIVCWIFYKESHFRIVRQKKLYRELASFASWNVIESLATIAKTQGTTILFNTFFGPAVNAANGIANQINGLLRMFSGMINTASNPQIVKTYASNDRVSMYKLVFQATKISFFLMFTMCLPLLFEMDLILRLWLTRVPQYTSEFSRLVLVDALLVVLSSTLLTVARATGKIAKMQIIVGGMLLLNIPFAYLLLKQGQPPYFVFFVSIGLSLMGLIARMLLLRTRAGLSVRAFCGQVLVRLAFLVMMSVVPVIAFNTYVPDRQAQLIVNLGVAPLWSVLVMWFLVFQPAERRYVLAGIAKVLSKVTGKGRRRAKSAPKDESESED